MPVFKFFKKKIESYSKKDMSAHEKMHQVLLAQKRVENYQYYLDLFKEYKEKPDELLKDMVSSQDYWLYFADGKRRNKPVDFKSFEKGVPINA